MILISVVATAGVVVDISATVSELFPTQFGRFRFSENGYREFKDLCMHVPPSIMAVL